MKSLNRRSFLKSTALAAAAFSLPARSWAQVEGSNSDVRVAVVGFGGRGKDHISGFRKTFWRAHHGAVRRGRRCPAQGSGQVQDNDGKPVEVFTDIRKLLESKNVDVVTIATPNHWHSLAASGRFRRARMCMRRSRFRTTCGKAASSWKRRASTRRLSRPARRAVPRARALAQAVEWVKAGNLGKIVDRARPLLQTAPEHRQSRWAAADSGGRRLRSLVRPGGEAAAHAQETALRLALGLEHRQRRSRQPGHSPDGHLPLVSRRKGTGAIRRERRRTRSATSTTAKRPTRRSFITVTRRLR